MIATICSSHDAVAAIRQSQVLPHGGKGSGFGDQHLSQMAFTAPWLALQASGLDQVNVAHRPRLLSDNGPSYVSVELAAGSQQDSHSAGAFIR